METQGGGHGRRSPSPPPPSADAPLSSREPEEAAVAAPSEDTVNQESEQGTAAASPSLDDHANVAEEHDDDDEEGAEEGEEAAVESGEGPAILTDDLREKIVRQVEYYFSDENLPTDKFMLKHVKKDKQGFVPIAVVASFRRMNRLVRDLSLIEAALRTSAQLVVSKDGRKVRRLYPLPITEIKDTKSCTVIVENLPDDYSTDNLQKIFANIGKILNITIHEPHSIEESKRTWKTKMIFSSKLHALIEYEMAEAAANAVATLNDEKNWRSGMRVELLRQRMEEEHFAGGKGRHKNRYRSRGRGQQNASGQGHGQVPPGSSNGVSKPPPGPRMPDGTRGFTMGRGKPSISEPSQHGV